MDRTAPPRSDTWRAAAWMLGAIASFTAMAVAGRAVSHELDTFEIMLWRSVIGVAVMLSVATALRRWNEVSRERLPLHLARNAAHFAGQNLWFHAITVLPLATVFALEFTSPLWVLLLSIPLLGERPGWTRAGIALLGFAGVLLVARPGADMPPGVIWAALAAVGFALTNVATKRLTRDESTLSILVWLTAMQLVLGLAFAGWDGDIAAPSAAAAPWIGLIGLAGLCAHWSLTNALALAPASTVMPIDFARLPLIAGIGAWAYGESLDPLTLLGGGIVFAAAYANLRLADRPA
ncbi:DMT family transporter [Jannaschia sp. Os4]|uniref:DMT family transporter n=1 Tax=Jannaschia sp. Os4 TaxID=2807617 RepID=UPI001939ADCA|nr:DMT family transporter [Jannaschia sp. Os4]MBM2576672.1 DMT family transporter [Jannaschia sp. Os4]